MAVIQLNCVHKIWRFEIYIIIIILVQTTHVFMKI